MNVYGSGAIRVFAGIHGLWRLALLLLLPPFLLIACVDQYGVPGTRAPINVLNALVALAADDVWAVGGMTTSQAVGPSVLIEHWDGTTWHAAMPALAGELCAISASAANDIWTVGTTSRCSQSTPSFFPPSNGLLTLHWDGHTWQQVSVPLSDLGQGCDVCQREAALHAVVALSPHDAWAVGYQFQAALIEHWDGQQWSPVPQSPPGPGHDYSSLQAMAARSANDIWAVGSTLDFQHNAGGSLAEHWDGHSWTMITMPSLEYPDCFGLTAFPPGQLWCVGGFGSGTPPLTSPLIERWDGTTWQVVLNSMPAQPGQRQEGVSLQAVAVGNAQDAWAVGFRVIDFQQGVNQALALHWDGQAWQPVNTPTLRLAGHLTTLAVLTANDIWAAGSTYANFYSGSKTLIVHWNGRVWQQVPSPSPGTPGLSVHG